MVTEQEVIVRGLRAVCYIYSCTTGQRPILSLKEQLVQTSIRIILQLKGGLKLGSQWKFQTLLVQTRQLHFLQMQSSSK
jgi:hypothetical protein